MSDDLLELSMWRDGSIVHGSCLDDMKKLKAERDEARREVCECKVHQQHDPMQFAQERGWYCFKRDSLSQEVSQDGCKEKQ